MGFILAILLLLWNLGEACTAFQLKSQDGAIVYARSMEFGYALDSEILIVPHNIEFEGTVPQNQTGIKWKVKYGYAGLNQALERMLVSDGMNEKGLVVGSLYLPGFAQYEPYDPKRKESSLGAWELPSFLLATCASIAEVKKALKNIVVVEEPTPQMDGFILPLHFYVSDKSGEVLIVEYVKGVRHEYANPVGALTNSPPFDWHVTNLANFIHLSPDNTDQLSLPGFIVPNLGQGTGLFGLPGDYTPTSRFVRAVLFSKWATVQKSAIETVRMAFHILNSFDIFEGIVRMKKKDPEIVPPGTSDRETTQWVIVHDQTNLKSYIRSYESLRIQGLSFDKIDFNATVPKSISLNRDFQVDELLTQ